MYSCHVLGAAERRKTVLESQELRALAGEREEEWSRKGAREVANIKGSQFSVIRIESPFTKGQKSLCCHHRSWQF